jgi:hypothetical protein
LRYAKALAMLNRAAEAYTWVADRIAESGCEVDDTVLDIFAAISKASAHCKEFFKGLYIQRDEQHGGYKVRTAVKIKQRTTLSEETPVVGWHSSCIFHDKEFGAVMDQLMGEVDMIPMINGIFPRRYDEIPFDVQSLTDLDTRVRKHIDEKKESKRAGLTAHRFRDIVRALACSKASGHEDGLYHFGAMYNHSCAPDNEIMGYNVFTGVKRMKVVAMRDIPAGAEVCNTYLNWSMCHLLNMPQSVDYSDGIGALHLLDMPPICRQLSMERSFGELCWCSRCKDEMSEENTAKHGFQPPLRTKTPQDQVVAAEKAWMDFQREVEPIMNDRERVLQFWRDGFLTKSEILKDWDAVPWKKTFLMANYAKRLEELVRELQEEFKGIEGTGDQKAMMAHFDRMREKYDKYQSVKYLLRLLERKHKYLREGSFSHQPIYKVLIDVMKVYLATKRYPEDFGEQRFRELYQYVQTALKLSEDLIT